MVNVHGLQAYWDWSVDEMATYDLPAMLSLVNSIALQKVHYIGYSQVSYIIIIKHLVKTTMQHIGI